MRNIIEETVPGLLTSAGDAAKAAEQYGEEIVILQNPAVKIRAEITGLATAADAYEQAKAALSQNRAAVRDIVKESRNQLTLGRDLFKPLFGPEYNAAWDIVGLVDSLAIPRTHDEVQPLIRSFSAFLAAHPEQEVASKNITAEKFTVLFTELDNARAAVRLQELAMNNALEVREEKFGHLRKRMRDLIDELNMRLTPLDARWKAFGFNQPGAQEIPGIPENVKFTLHGNNAALAWAAPARAEYFHVWKHVFGVDAEPVLVGSPADLDFTLEALPANSTTEVTITAVNNGGESGPSDVVKIVTP